MSKRSGLYGLAILLTSLLLFGCAGGDDDAPDGDRADGDMESDGDGEGPADGDAEPDDDAGEDQPTDLFQTVWWEAPDESSLLELLEASDFFAARPELVREMSSWFEHTVHAAPGEEPSNSADLGYYGIGNGVVFGFVGTWYPRNTIHGILGPIFERDPDEGFFSDASVWLERDGRRLKWKEEWAWKWRETQIPLTRMQVSDSPLELDTITFAPAGESSGEEKHCIVQLINVRNPSEEEQAGITVRVQTYSKADGSGEGYIDQERGKMHMKLSGLGETWALLPAEGEDYEALRTPPFSLGPGEERQLVLIYEFRLVEDPLGPGAEAVASRGWETLLYETRDWWRAWHAKGLHIRTPDTRVNDFIEEMKAVVKIQQAENGALCPMSHYTSIWMRDSFGPTRMFLRFGYPEEAWAINDYYYGAASVRNGIGNALDADVPIPDELPPVEWRNREPFTGRLRGEGPTHIPLMHAWLWQYTGEGEKVADRWDYLIYTLENQTITPDGMMYFSGDETFRPQLATNLGMDTDYLFEELTWSSFSAFLFATAAERMAAFGREFSASANDIAWLDERASFVRQKTEEHYWLEEQNRYSPFIYMDTMTPETRPSEDVNTQPVWLSYLPSDDPKVLANIRSVSDEILQDNGILQNRTLDGNELLGFPVGEGIMTGMTPAYFLYNVAELNLPTQDLTFDAVGEYASPAGEIPEVGLFAQPRRALSPIYNRSSKEGEIWARHRQWEGAVAAEALLHYLIGYEADVNQGWIKLSPRLPHESPWIEAENLLFAGHPMSLSYARSAEGFVLRLTAEEAPTTYGLSRLLMKPYIYAETLTRVTVNGVELGREEYEIKLFDNAPAALYLEVEPTEAETTIEIWLND
ncbi:MAG: hypothetical protein C4523_13640 [Myxococcales bacterium]|nr:MAG: hypothetical protein C4523_13640 [Myxococcales bacterium]